MERKSFQQGNITFIHGSESQTHLWSILSIETRTWKRTGLRHALASNLDSSHPATIFLVDADGHTTERIDPQSFIDMRSTTGHLRIDFLDEYSRRMKEATRVVFTRPFPRTEIPQAPQDRKKGDRGGHSAGH